MNNNIIHKDNGDFEVEPTLEDVEFTPNHPIPPPKFFLESKNFSGIYADVNDLLEKLQTDISYKFYVYSLDTSLNEKEREKTLVKFKVIVKLEREE